MENRVIYGVREEIYCIGEKKRRSYGVVAYADMGEDTIFTVIAAVGDVTGDRAKLFEFVEICNEKALDIRHLHDAVEDLLLG